MACIGKKILFLGENDKYSRHLCKFWKEFISFDIKKKGQYRIGIRFCEGKGKFGKS
jgi:hypothetical protein